MPGQGQGSGEGGLPGLMEIKEMAAFPHVAEGGVSNFLDLFLKGPIALLNRAPSYDLF